jgi:hypothetical protein
LLICALAGAVPWTDARLSPRTLAGAVPDQDFYRAFDTLWLDSQEFEELARAQLVDPRSPVNVRGLQATAMLNESRRAYLCWFQESAEDDFVPLANCPRCAAPLVLCRDRLVCEDCRIAVYN